jgi:hypothetical protein
MPVDAVPGKRQAAGKAADTVYIKSYLRSTSFPTAVVVLLQAQVAGQLLVGGANVFRESGRTRPLKRSLQVQAFGQSGGLHQLWVAEDIWERRSPIVHSAKQARDLLE